MEMKIRITDEQLVKQMDEVIKEEDLLHATSL